MRLEHLEQRQLLAVGPQLIGITPNDGELLLDHDVRHTAPSELTFRFDESQIIDPETLLDGIRILRSGFDDVFDDNGDMTVDDLDDNVPLSSIFIGIGDAPNEVVVRFGETLPDDLYQIDVVGSGNTPLRNIAGDPFNDGVDFRQTFELDLGAQVVAVVPQPTSRNDDGDLVQARDQIIVYFNDDDLKDDASSAENTDFYQLIATRDTVANTDDIVFSPVSVDYDPDTDSAVLTFAANIDELTDDAGTYRLRIGNDEILPAAPEIINIGGEAGDEPGDNNFDIDVVFVDNSLTPSQQAIFTEAADRWSEVIIGDLPAVSFIDDVLIFARAPFIDGPGGVLGQAGPTATRAIGGLTYLGNMEFDIADVAAMEASGDLFSVILHEMGHVLGIGTLWNRFNLLEGAGTADPRFVGDQAVEEYNALFGLEETSVPVANTGSAGTRDAHWRESVFEAELMTGFLNSGGLNPLSRITVGSLQDEGYVVNLEAADDFGPAATAGASAQTDGTALRGTILAVPYDPHFDPQYVDSEIVAEGIDGVVSYNHSHTENEPGNWGLIDTGWDASVTEGFGAVARTAASTSDGPDGFTASAHGGQPGSSYDTARDLHTEFDTGVAIVVTGDGSVLVDGQTFEVEDNDGNVSTFEFDSNSSLNIVTATQVPFLLADSPDDVATAIAAAINDDGTLNVAASANGNRVSLANDARVDLSASIAGISLDLSTSVILSSSIDPELYPLTLPGAIEQPGHRDVPVQSHLLGGADAFSGITTQAYNFQDVYGQDPQGSDFHNLITEAQKQRAREIFELYSDALGIEFFESESTGWTIATGDLRALDPNVDTGPGGVIGIAGGGRAVMDAAELWSDEFGVSDDPQRLSWFAVAMHEIGHLLGLGHTDELPTSTIMNGILGNPTIFPGDHDVVHGQHIFRPESNDIDLYRFEVESTGLFSAETIAERRTNSSLLNSALTLFREDEAGNREVIARNDDYFSEDAFIQMELEPGIYYVGVTASGNLSYDPSIEGTGYGGVTQGEYDLRLNFRAATDRGIIDNGSTLNPLEPGTSLDGDADGVPGGIFDFWFHAAAPSGLENAGDPRTLFVDKSADPGGDGALATPFNNISDAFVAAEAIPDRLPGDIIVRIVGNGGADEDSATLDDNLGYEIGFDLLSQPLADGTSMNVPQGVTVMVDAGAIFKLRSASINVGSTAPAVDRSAGALQVLGTPQQAVFFTSFDDEQIGADTNPVLSTTPGAGDWGGILFRGDLDQAAMDQNPDIFDFESRGIFINYVGHADIRYGGGEVVIDSVAQVVNPVSMIDTRPTIQHNQITLSADAAISANPNSFEETNFHAPEFQASPFTSDVVRVGPDIQGNRLFDNSINGLFVRIQTPAGNDLQALTVPGRWDDTDIVHVVAENLVIQGTPGGSVLNDETMELEARIDARLVIDPGTIVKLSGSRIEAALGAQLIAEGLPGAEIIFTSLLDDRYGTGGSFDTNGNANRSTPGGGDWSGLYVGIGSQISMDHALVAFAGGLSKIEGGFAGFNALEVHQGTLRVTNSTFEQAASGTGGQSTANRGGRGPNSAGTIFVRGAQPVIVNNVIRNGRGPAISINANALNHFLVADPGRSTGFVDSFDSLRDNQGPLVRLNQLGNNDTNGMVVRGEELTTQSVWDDTDIVHVVLDTITVPNFHTYGGLRLESSPTESLVVKLSGGNAGFTATGNALDIDDRIGGTVQIVGKPGRPVVLTSLSDQKFGAGFKPDGTPQTNTANEGTFNEPLPGDWRGILIEQFANDRNVEIVTEGESPSATAPGSNATPGTAQFLGALAPHEKAGDDNRRLGFEIHGLINEPSDVDVYSFSADAGTEVWFDVDRTTQALDTVLELIDVTGRILARSDNSHAEAEANEVDFVDETVFANDDLRRDVNTLPKSVFNSQDGWTTNVFDAGMRVVLPGPLGTTNTYHVRLRSGSTDLDVGLFDGLTQGAYQLQLRLRETDEFPGSTVRHADIRYATTAIEVIGLPTHSPLLGEAAEDNSPNDTFDTAQFVGNPLVTDRGALSVAGNLEAEGDVDWYRIELSYNSTQSPGEFASLVFDIDYADQVHQPNTYISVFDVVGNLVLTGGDSNIADDVPAPLGGADLDDLSRGSVGKLDASIGPISLPTGTYFIAVSSDALRPQELQAQYLDADAENTLIRLEPIDSLIRIAEDHVGLSGGSTTIGPRTNLLLGEVDDMGQFDATSSVVPFYLGDVVLFVSSDSDTNETEIRTVDPFTGTLETVIGAFGEEVRDIAMRPDGGLFTFSVGIEQNGGPTDGNSGGYFQIDTGTAATTSFSDDGIETYEEDPDNLGEAIRSNDDAGVGIQFNAITFANDDDLTGFAVGDRGDAPGPPAGAGPEFVTNILYEFDSASGATVGQGDNREDADLLLGAGTQIVELGQIDTTVGDSGVVTGIAFVDGTLFAVDDAGGLYESDLAGGTTFIATVMDSGGAPIAFSGLSVGPTNLEDSLYAETLFGIDAGGAVYAFDALGALQPVFVDSQTSIDTGVAGAHGLAFSTLDRNLWHVTTEDRREADAGHGFEVPVTTSREEADGGVSFYFGNETDDNPADAANPFIYNYPGGAHGTLVTNSFDLSAYTPTDQPILYFNYFLDTENAAGGNEPEDMRDSFRVFISDTSEAAVQSGFAGNWFLLGTNNSFRDSGEADEFDLPLNNNDNYGDIQEFFDNTGGWRQARIPLDDFAGLDSLRLRFDFSTAGSMDLGKAGTTGSELRAVPGSNLIDGGTFAIDEVFFEFDLGYTLVTATAGVIADGDTFIIDDGFLPPVTFEFDFDSTSTDMPVVLNGSETASEVAELVEQAILAEGLFDDLTTIVTPTGAQLLDGDTVTISGVVFEFDSDGMVGGEPVPFTPLDSSGTIARNLLDAINNSTVAGVTASPNGHRLVLHGATDVMAERIDPDDPDALPTIGVEFDGMFLVNNRLNLLGGGPGTESTMDGLIVEGAPGTAEIPIVVNSAMTAAEIAEAISPVLEAEFSADPAVVANSFKVFNGTVQIIGHPIDDAGPLGFADSLVGDGNGAFVDDDDDNDGAPRGIDNDHEGVYIDDLVIGFAERGEIVVGADFVDEGDDGVADTDFVANTVVPDSQSGIGEYQLEIRRAAEYGVPNDPPGQVLLRSFDTNDRQTQAISLFAPEGHDIVEGQTFKVSDGIVTVTFEYDDDTIDDGVEDGHVEIGFSPSESSAFIAQRIVDEINGDEIQLTRELAIVASQVAASNRIELFGDVVIVDPSEIEALGQDEIGDANRFRDQGQLLIHSNQIMHTLGFGIRLDAALRTAQDGNVPHPGSPRILRELNAERLAPGVTVANNVIADSGQGGIHLSGDPNIGVGPAGAVPFGRIINNTIFGQGGSLINLPGANDTGILIDQNASPTLLNNIIANTQQGIQVDGSSSSTVIFGTLFKGNISNSNVGTGDTTISLLDDDPLFVDEAAFNFILAAESQAIDSSIDSLEDRLALKSVKVPIGIPVSPILAPARDLTGQLRVDDPSVESPTGIGGDVFKDRGALDRADFVGPAAILLTPQDNDSGGADENPADTIVKLTEVVLTEFVVQISDSSESPDGGAGSGVDDTSVTSENVTVALNTLLLTDGIDYAFSYDTTNNIIQLTPLSGVWLSGIYTVTLNNDPDTGIRDLTGNPLAPNQLFGETRFTIELGSPQDFGDAPDESVDFAYAYPTRAENDGARHIISETFFLGTLIDAEGDGQPTAAADGDDNNGDNDEDGVVFDTVLFVGQDATITVTSSAEGFLDAWIDFNRDGDWNDPDEQIFASQPLVAGGNEMMIAIPITADTDTTYARFRLSSAGGLEPTGLAGDGEVEDYQVTVEGNPWQNPVNRRDVNNSGGDTPVSAIDALQIINEINDPVFAIDSIGTLPLPPESPNLPPPFFDVNGDFRVDAQDALSVINFINAIPPPATAMASAAATASAVAAEDPTVAFQALAIAEPTTTETIAIDTAIAIGSDPTLVENSSVDEVMLQLAEDHSENDRLLLDRLLLDGDWETSSLEDEINLDGWDTEELDEDLDLDAYEQLFASWDPL